FVDVLKEVELHRHAGGNSGRAGGQRCTVTQATTGRTERGSSGILDGEGHTVRAGIDELEGKVVGEALHVDRRGEPGAAGLGLPTIGQLQTCAIQLGASIELQTSGGKSGSEIDGGRAPALNGDDRGGGVAGREVRRGGDGFDRGRTTD